jgi:hypothetical protein
MAARAPQRVYRTNLHTEGASHCVWDGEDQRHVPYHMGDDVSFQGALCWISGLGVGHADPPRDGLGERESLAA